MFSLDPALTSLVYARKDLSPLPDIAGETRSGSDGANTVYGCVWDSLEPVTVPTIHHPQTPEP